MGRTLTGAAIVTGASSGIGLEIATILARRGNSVVLVARSEDRLRELAGRLGAGAHVVPCDLADRDARAALPARVAELGLVPEILVNNAGFSTMGPVASSDAEAEVGMLEVDVVAVADLCSRFVPGMVARGRGAVLNVASTAAFQPLPGQAGYAAAKAFVLSYTQSLAGELRGTGVTATALGPGPVHTGFGERAGFADHDAEDALPAFLWVEADRVARLAVDGMDRGRLVVIPGVGNRVGSVFAALAPRKLLVPILAKQHPALR
ncbi:MAG: SDR family NAD(P)-dependent oxidoreductase [Jatrophihabitans sp.]|uniref:SDR family NAD(P)-dependent oxidoreductase n=1 Tax=Jatrophihabitans sp. TaxID=1932789 RepID=UPI003F7D32F0